MMAVLSSGWRETFQPSLLVDRWKWRRSEMGFWRTWIFIQEIRQHTHRSLFLAKGRPSNGDSAQDPRVVASKCGLPANRLVMLTLWSHFNKAAWSTRLSNCELFTWVQLACSAAFSNSTCQICSKGHRYISEGYSYFSIPLISPLLDSVSLSWLMFSVNVCGHSHLLNFLYTVCYAWNVFPSKLSTWPTLTQLESVTFFAFVFVFKDVII